MGCNKQALVALLGSVLAAGAAQVQADPSASMMANTCAGCHGTAGQSVGPASPNLAGMSESYFIDSMIAFREDARPASIMNRIAKGYTEEQIETMATYFAELPVYKAAQTTDPAKVKMGAEVYDAGCAKCHDENGGLPDDDAGILAGQWLPWLQYSMADFQAGNRDMPKKMAKEVEKLSAEEIDAVLHFFASQK
jgi:sulfide dehydrogenase cytochrome subunit